MLHNRQWILHGGSQNGILQNVLVELMLPAYVYIPSVLRIEDKFTVVALVSSGEMDVFDVARQSVSPCRCLVTDSTLVSHYTSLLLYSLNILNQALLVSRIVSCKNHGFHPISI